MKLDIIIIATVRPEIFRMTLATFTARLLNQFQVRVFINVDPAGETDRHTQADIVNICREYFDEVISNTPPSPSFAKAVQWGWQQVETPFYFHLEEDWILKREVDAQAVLQLFENPAVVNVFFNRFDKEELLDILRSSKARMVLEYNKQFIHHHSLSFNPGFYRTAYIKQIGNRLETDKDPEYQYEDERKRITGDFPNPIILWQVSNESLIIDIGRAWRKLMNISKRGSSTTPTYWKYKTHPFLKRVTAYKTRLAFRRIKYDRQMREWERLYLPNQK